MRSTLLLIFLSICSYSYAQITPYGFDLDSLKLMVEEDTTYLKELNEIFFETDSIVDFGTAYWIYYGSAYLDSYSPYGERMSSRLTNELRENGQHKEMIEMSEGLYRSNPGFVRALLDIGLAHESLEDTLMAKKYFEKYVSLLSVPFNSGSGESIDSAIIVRSVDDEYLIIGEYGYRMKAQSLVFENDIPYDVMETENADGEERTFYFNIYQPYILGLRDLLGGELKEDKKQETKKEKRKRKKEERKKKKADKKA